MQSRMRTVNSEHFHNWFRHQQTQASPSILTHPSPKYHSPLASPNITRIAAVFAEGVVLEADFIAAALAPH